MWTQYFDYISSVWIKNSQPDNRSCTLSGFVSHSGIVITIAKPFCELWDWAIERCIDNIGSRVPTEEEGRYKCGKKEEEGRQGATRGVGLELVRLVIIPDFIYSFIYIFI